MLSVNKLASVPKKVVYKNLRAPSYRFAVIVVPLLLHSHVNDQAVRISVFLWNSGI